MGCDHAGYIPVCPFVRELWHLKINIWSCDRHCGPNLVLYTKRAYNCRMFNTPYGRCHGNCNMNMMRCDHASCVPVGRLVGDLWHFEYFPTWRPSTILNFKKLIFDPVTVIVVLICCCIPNFNKIGSCVRPHDAHNCWMYNTPLLGNDICHGNRIMADMSRTCCVTVSSLVGELWHFEYFRTWRCPPFWILETVVFNHVTVIVVLTYCCVPNFIEISSRARSPDDHNCRMFNAPHGRCHGNRNMAETSRTWWHATTQVAFQLIHW